MGLVEQLNRVQLIEKIDTHLRNTARQLIKFNTLHETLDYLIESFWKQFKCDYVSILLKEGDFLFNDSPPKNRVYISFAIGISLPKTLQ